MIISAVSLDNHLFMEDYPNSDYFIDGFNILQDLKFVKKNLPVVDIGPSEAFESYPLLNKLVRSLYEVGFVTRLLTSAKYFNDLSETIRQFVELNQLGVQSFFLGLDTATIDSLPETNVMNFIAACSKLGSLHP